MTVWAIMLRELAALLWTPLGWLVLTLFLLLQGYSFYLCVGVLTQPYAPPGGVLELFFGGSPVYWLLLILIVCVLTMRLLAEERRSGTLETLLAAPVCDAEVVLGKYLAVLLFYAFLWLPTGVYVLLVAQLQAEPGLQGGPVAAAYLGNLLLGASCLALGLLGSALTSSQLVAALVTASILIGLMLLDPLAQLGRWPPLHQLVELASPRALLAEMSRGIVDSRRVVFQLSLALFALVAAGQALKARRWR